MVAGEGSGTGKVEQFFDFLPLRAEVVLSPNRDVKVYRAFRKQNGQSLRSLGDLNLQLNSNDAIQIDKLVPPPPAINVH